MTIKAPAGSKAEVMQWLQGLRDKGFQRVIDLVQDNGRGESITTALLDPSKANIFLGDGEQSKQGTSPDEAMEALIKA